MGGRISPDESQSPEAETRVWVAAIGVDDNGTTTTRFSWATAMPATHSRLKASTPVMIIFFMAAVLIKKLVGEVSHKQSFFINDQF